MTRVALDAMGGDVGVPAAVEGVAKLTTEDTPVEVLLVGDPRLLAAELRKHRHDPARVRIVEADGVVGMAEDARHALEARPRASVAVAAELVAAGEADALVSAGHTAATILAASRRLKRLPGVRRAALAAVYPTEQRHGPRGDPFALMLDVGATLDATAEDLVAFAVMGSAYARVVSDNPAPRVALLSNGAEPNRGTPTIVEAHRLLAGTDRVAFAGNVEGLDIPRGTVDVVVCDGFLGNVVLKMLEGVGEVVADIAKDAYARRFLWRLGLTLLSQGVREIRTLTDWKQYGGAPLLGLDHVVIKAHGRSNARAFRNAVKLAAKAAHGGLSERIAEGMGAPG